NYAQAFRATCAGSGPAALERLLATSNAGHAAWLALPEGEVLSLSPELFLRVRDGHITTRPIKGTAPRAGAPEADAALRHELEASAKNRAENLMIVDLLRHDIGQHAETGSVRVERLFEVESLPQVHHLVSTVTGRLRPGSTAVDLVRDCFPGGSITGAPKKRAMEIIAELEDTPRSVYCGSIGFIGADGAVELNIAIRTLLRQGDVLHAWAGGGIVADSECDAEYEECFHKIGALLRALEAMRDDAP
ncbi:MAG TPA: anthranilate synthase component I family protein, partial [Moraxellaceae bacterium]|nr:anthranilate synthase component I family protein [Moraxellaceae bacterium]